ncbi:MTH1187 family thiamine-binding protein [Bacillus sp. EB01]|uniref:MTH1187 family thiamine-binding protein n=1 Tax=Bacillus sp. EB01 TaxID=1347086 RepID=UPI0005C4E0AB|nr:MTH1187 family thiamine-binding protein [Bacillus sp. EB01]
MAIIDVTVIPVGTGTPSVSEYVAEIHRVLKRYEGRVKYQLTPMSTLIEGDLTELLQLVREIHEVPFEKGLQRVCTNIRIDDRRDKESTMEKKLKAVESRLEEM